MVISGTVDSMAEAYPSRYHLVTLAKWRPRLGLEKQMVRTQKKSSRLSSQGVHFLPQFGPLLQMTTETVDTFAAASRASAVSQIPAPAVCVRIFGY